MLPSPRKAVLVSVAFVVILWGNLSIALIAFSTMTGGVLYGAGDFASSRVLPSMAASIFFMGVSGFLPLYLIAFWVKLRWLSRRARIVATSSLFIVCLCAFPCLSGKARILRRYFSSLALSPAQFLLLGLQKKLAKKRRARSGATAPKRQKTR